MAMRIIHFAFAGGLLFGCMPELTELPKPTDETESASLGENDGENEIVNQDNTSDKEETKGDDVVGGGDKAVEDALDLNEVLTNRDPSIEVLFPLAGANVEGLSSVELRGRIAYSNGYSAPKQIASLTINGATISDINNPQHGNWSSIETIDIGDNHFDVEVNYLDGSKENLTHSIVNIPKISGGIGRYFNDDQSVFYIAGSGVFSFDMNSGSRDYYPLSSALSNTSVAIDFERDRIVAVSSDHDPSRDKFTLYEFSTGKELDQRIGFISGEEQYQNAQHVDFHCTNPDAVLVWAGITNRIVQEDINTGVRTLLLGKSTYDSSTPNGAGSFPLQIGETACRPDGRYLIADALSLSITQLDLDTLEQTELLTDVEKYGDAYLYFHYYAMNEDASNVYYEGVKLDGTVDLVRVDTSTGNTAIIGNLPRIQLVKPLMVDEINQRALYHGKRGAFYYDWNAANYAYLFEDIELDSNLPKSISRLVYDIRAKQLIVINSSAQSIAVLDTQKNEWRAISFSEENSEVKLNSIRDIVRSPLDDNYYLTDGNANRVVSLNPATGSLKLLSGYLDQVNLRGKGSAGRLGDLIAADFTRNRLLISDFDSNDVYLVAVDLASGDRSVLSSTERGTGPEIKYIEAFSYDESTQTALVYSEQAQKIYSINATTGNRSEVFTVPVSEAQVTLSAQSNIAYYRFAEQHPSIDSQLRRVDLKTGLDLEIFKNGSCLNCGKMAIGAQSDILFTSLYSEDSVNEITAINVKERQHAAVKRWQQ